MKKLSLFILLLLVAFTILGCSGGLTGGGSGGGTNSAKDNSGSMTLTVNWPGVGTSEASKGIPSSTYSIKVNVCAQVLQDGVTKYNREVNAALIIRRNTSASTESVTINGIPSGSKTVIAQAFNGTAAEIAYGTKSATIVQGDNSGVTVTLSSGTFPYSIIGPGDVTTPTDSSGGGGTTTTTKYFFVNNYGDGTISVLQEVKTTASGSSASTYSVSVAGTITTGISKPCRGVFDTTGSYYYLVSGDPATPYVYKVTPNTTTWSASTVSILYNQFPAQSYLQEILYDSGYLYVTYKYFSGANYRGGIKKIKVSDGTLVAQADEIFGDHDYQIGSLYKVSTGKLVISYTEDSNLYAAVCNENGATISVTGAVRARSPGDFLGTDMRYVCAITMSDSSTVYVPGSNPYGELGLISKFTLNSNDTFTLAGQYAVAANQANGPNFRKVLYYNNTLYALSSLSSGISYVYYGTTSSMTAAPIYGYSTSSMSDMAFSYDNTRIYITDFGGEFTSANYVWYKTLSAMSSSYTPITVGLRPFSIALKP